jgi:aminopeptidase N
MIAHPARLGLRLLSTRRRRLSKIETELEATMESRSLFAATAKKLFLILCLVSLAFAGMASGQAQSGAPPAAQTPAGHPAPRALPPLQTIPAHYYDQRNIKLDLRFDWEHEQAIGTATITLAPVVKDLQRVDFDAAYMSISAVSLRSGAPLQFEYDATREKLSVLLDRAYQPSEELIVVISYKTNQPPPGRGKGLNFIKPRPDDPTRPRQIWTQGEAETNRQWFPSFDHPNDFVTTEIVATVEKPLSVISNGKLMGVKENADGTRTFDWKIDEPHATYLTSIVVGEFAPISAEYAGIPVVTNVYPNETAEGKITAARLLDMVKFFSEKTGVKYPYAKYAQTTVRDFGGGMENISATTQTDNMIHDARTELDSTADGLESHELAHQWFGDYVTCSNWSDIWLNEGFATYFQALWDEHNLGHDDFLYLDVKNNQDQYYQAWGRGQRRPIVTHNYAGPESVFDAYAYPRGGAVLHMLRTFLGEDNWWRSIHHYLTKYAHQPVETEQFRVAIEETTGQPMDWFFDEWLYKMGHPVFRVTQDYDAGRKILKLTVRQEQHPDPESLYPQAGFFQTPVDIEIATAKGSRIERVQIAPKEDQTFELKAESEPAVVSFDYGSTLIKELVFSKSKEQLLYQLAHDQDVLGRIWALHELAGKMKDANTGEVDRQTIVKALGDAATQDKVWGTRLEAVIALNGVKEAKEALLAATKDANARVRARAVNSLAATKDASLANVYQEMVNDQSYGVIRASAIALGQTKSPTAYDALLKLIDAPSWRDTIRASGLSGLAGLGDKRALELGFHYFAAGNPTAVQGAALALIGATGKDDPRTFPLLSKTLMDAVEKREFRFFAGAAETLVSLGDERGLTIFQELRKKIAEAPAGLPTFGAADLGAAVARYESRLSEKIEQTKPKS